VGAAATGRAGRPADAGAVGKSRRRGRAGEGKEGGGPGAAAGEREGGEKREGLHGETKTKNSMGNNGGGLTVEETIAGAKKKNAD
jgi:hypothetical protein